MPASSSPPCYNWVKYAAVLRKAALPSPPPPPPSLQPLVIPFVQTGDLKCKRAPCWKSQPSSGQLSAGSLWLDCLCTAVNALGGCWPRWLTVVLGTATHCHVSRWCMRKKKRGGGGSPEYPAKANDAAEDSSVSQASTVSPDLKQRPVIWQCNYWTGCSRTPTAASNKGNEAKGRGCKCLSCYLSYSYFGRVSTGPVHVGKIKSHTLMTSMRKWYLGDDVWCFQRTRKQRDLRKQNNIPALQRL